MRRHAQRGTRHTRHSRRNVHHATHWKRNSKRNRKRNGRQQQQKHKLFPTLPTHQHTSQTNKEVDALKSNKTTVANRKFTYKDAVEINSSRDDVFVSQLKSSYITVLSKLERPSIPALTQSSGTQASSRIKPIVRQTKRPTILPEDKLENIITNASVDYPILSPIFTNDPDGSHRDRHPPAAPESNIINRNDADVDLESNRIDSAHVAIDLLLEHRASGTHECPPIIPLASALPPNVQSNNLHWRPRKEDGERPHKAHEKDGEHLESNQCPQMHYVEDQSALRTSGARILSSAVKSRERDWERLREQLAWLPKLVTNKTSDYFHNLVTTNETSETSRECFETLTILDVDPDILSPTNVSSID